MQRVLVQVFPSLDSTAGLSAPDGCSRRHTSTSRPICITVHEDAIAASADLVASVSPGPMVGFPVRRITSSSQGRVGVLHPCIMLASYSVNTSFSEERLTWKRAVSSRCEIAQESASYGWMRQVGPRHQKIPVLTNCVRLHPMTPKSSWRSVVL